MTLMRRMQKFIVSLCLFFAFAVYVTAQEVSKKPELPADPAKKANSRPAQVIVDAPEPFAGASVEKMAYIVLVSRLKPARSRLK